MSFGGWFISASFNLNLVQIPAEFQSNDEYSTCLTEPGEMI